MVGAKERDGTTQKRQRQPEVALGLCWHDVTEPGWLRTHCASAAGERNGLIYGAGIGGAGGCGCGCGVGCGVGGAAIGVGVGVGTGLV